MKKILVCFLTAAALAWGLCACSAAGFKVGGPAGFNLKSDKEVYAFSAASTVMLMDTAASQIFNEEAVKAAYKAENDNKEALPANDDEIKEKEENAAGEENDIPTTSGDNKESRLKEGKEEENRSKEAENEHKDKESEGAAPAQPPLSEEERQQLQDYMALVQNVLKGGNLVVDETASDRAEYAKMMKVSFKGAGQELNYVLYYNETVAEDEEDEEEKESVIEGILVEGERTYAVRGGKELEDGEYEIEFKAFLDKNNYIKVKQEIEDDESEFKYSVFRDGRLSRSMSLSYEKEGGETELKLSVFSEGKSTVFKFKEDEGKLKVTLIKDGIKNRYRIETRVDKEGNTVIEFYQWK